MAQLPPHLQNLKNQLPVPRTDAPAPAPAPAPEPVLATPQPVAPPAAMNAQQPRTAAKVALPSGGKFYGTICPDGEVEVYPMTGKDEALVADMNPADVGEIFDTLLQRCLKTPMDVNDMLSTDKFYLMLLLRANSYGSFYEFRVRCPNCGFAQPGSCNVPDDFDVVTYKGTGQEPFYVTLPVSGHTVGFRLLRGKDDREVVRWRNREMERNPDFKGDAAYTYRMAKHIVTIDGRPPENIGKAIEFFENLLVKDTSELDQAIEEQISGVNTAIDLSCAKCRVAFRADMPFTASFFRARRRRA